jgi:threonine synthase
MTRFLYHCSTCGKSYQRDEVRYLCPACARNYHPGQPLLGVLTAQFDYPAIRKRFKKEQPDWNLFSPVETEYYPDYPVGNTPFFKATALGRELGFENLWLKNDGLNPSASLKDRASFLVVAEANRLKEPTIVTASTGNAASALAAVCAAAGKQALILVPATAPRAKLVQMLLFGARVIPIDGTYDDAFRLSLEYTNSHGGLNRNTAYHPLTIEGKKTVGLEIFQRNKFRTPDVILVPVGDGVILAGVYKAFYDLKAAGLIRKLPRLVCVQSEKSSAIHHYIQTGKYQNARDPRTVADSISVSIPSNAHLARQGVLASNGLSITVTDEQILAAQQQLARTTGVFAEPASAATVAAVKNLRQDDTLEPQEQIVLLLTGHGLKDIDAAMRMIHIPTAVPPTIEAVTAEAARASFKSEIRNPTSSRA